MKRLVLIDGNAMLHRAYHAYPPLTSSKGELVNAVYGFLAMFLKILDEVKPAYTVVCFDRPKPTFRQALFVGYQAHRPSLADDFLPQIQLVHDILEAMKVAVFEVDGYEADDLIGTIAAQAAHLQKTQKTQKSRKSDVSDNQKIRSTGLSESSESSENIEVIIVSGDRDLLQLVNSHVKMLAPVTGITNMIVYDEALVEKKFGVKPSQFVDYKALVGDSSDGYPGVTGIGPKTAADIIHKFNTFENLYQHLEQLPPKISERLATDAQQAALAKKLATIVTDAPIQFDIEKCSSLQFDIEKTKELFEELGFKSLLDRLPGSKKPKEEIGIKRKKAGVGSQLGLLDV